MRKKKLLTPGPVEVRGGVRKEQSKPIIFHRSKEFEKLYKDCQNKLYQAFDVNPSVYSILLISGCGTMALEILLLSIFNKKDKILILINGYFGHRIKEIVDLAGFNYDIMELDWDKSMDLREIEDVIKRIRPKVMIVVSLETSTGVFNPIQKLGRLAKKYKLIFFVDAVSGCFGEDINIKRDNIDACVTVSNKALEAPPGVGIICVKRSLLRKPDRSRLPMTLDLFRVYQSAQDGQTPFTPNISLFQSLNKALKYFLKEGQAVRAKRYLNLSTIIRKNLISHGQKLLTNTDNFGNAITSLIFKSNKEAKQLQRYLEQHGFIVWLKNYEKVNNKMKIIVQISVMGDLNIKDVKKLDKILNRFYEEYR